MALGHSMRNTSFMILWGKTSLSLKTKTLEEAKRYLEKWVST